MILVDSNVVFDIVTNDERWAGWSQSQLEQAAAAGPLTINDVIYAETSIRFQTIGAFDRALEGARVTRAPLPKTALFLAGKAFAKYRDSGGGRAGVLPDLFIGAHAQVEQLPLLTRDVRRYRSYFPTVNLITP